MAYIYEKGMVSVIIPVYNASIFIRQCLDSLLRQSYVNWQAILIDDGSVDSSYSICQEYSRLDARFQVISKQNEGVSKARNLALDLCKGEFVFFLDADDYLLEESCLERMVSEMENNDIDLVRIDYQAVDENSTMLFINGNLNLRKKYFSKTLSVSDYCVHVIMDEYFLCLNLLRNEIIQKNRIRFIEGCRMREDAAFLLIYLSYSKQVMYLPNICYAYRKHSGAATAVPSIKIYSKDLSMVFDSLWPLLRDCTDKAYCSYLEFFLSNIVVDLRGSEFFQKRYGLCQQFRHKSLRYYCLGLFCFTDVSLSALNFIDRCIKKIKKSYV